MCVVVGQSSRRVFVCLGVHRDLVVYNVTLSTLIALKSELRSQNCLKTPKSAFDLRF